MAGCLNFHIFLFNFKSAGNKSFPQVQGLFNARNFIWFHFLTIFF